MSYQDGLTGQIANQSTVVIQTQHDLKDMVNRMRVQDKDVYKYPVEATMDNATVRIDINDLVFRVGTSRAPRQNMLNNAIEVTSNVNGLYINKHKVKGIVSDPENPSEEELLQVLSEGIRFMGQALNATVPNPDREENRKLQLTTRVQGTGEIINTGPTSLVPGDTLIWDLFTPSEVRSEQYRTRMKRFGFSETKVPLKTIPLSDAHVSYKRAVDSTFKKLKNGDEPSRTQMGQFGTAFVNALLKAAYLFDPSAGGYTFDDYKASPAARGIIAKLHSEASTETQALIEAFMGVVQDLKRREIGKVLSFSKPGKGVDILLGAN